ncbi:tyrosine recombinase XerC [Rhodococcus sp. NPDC060176]|uniref:site-specific integrase n=1 Tax=Rhodococcus sp. NPDC060176 TaxID=3347062 RepID=UPI0036546B27
MAGRPPLRIGQHGKIKRIPLGGDVFLARCRYRDDDGIVRIVERRSPIDVRDQHGKIAEEELLNALEARRAPSEDEIDSDTLISALCKSYLARLEEEGRAATTMSTYEFALKKLDLKIGGVRVSEASAGRIDTALRAMSKQHGPTMARQAKTILRGALGMAVLVGALSSNPVNDVSRIRSKNPPKGAKALEGGQLGTLLVALGESEYCQSNDLVDPITLLIATGVRRSELLAVRRQDIDLKAGTVAITGKVVRVKGVGLKRFDTTKSEAGLRTIPLPRFALDMLEKRAEKPCLGKLDVIFPSTAGTLRDPNNFGKQWRKVRDDLGVAESTSHTFRKSVATLIDDEGLSARVGADHLGHRNISMTQDKYMTRGRQHSEVADLLDKAVAINNE